MWLKGFLIQHLKRFGVQSRPNPPKVKTMSHTYFSNHVCPDCGGGRFETIVGLKCLECIPRLFRDLPTQKTPPGWFLEVLRQHEIIKKDLDLIEEKGREQEILQAELAAIAAKRKSIPKKDPNFAKAKDLAWRIKKLDWLMASLYRQYQTKLSILSDRLAVELSFTGLAGVPADWWDAKDP